MASGRFEDAVDDRILIVIIDGPVSSGKTTWGEQLMKRSPSLVKFFHEVGHVEDDADAATVGNPVDIFLSDPKRYAAPFQMLMHALCYHRYESAIAQAESLAMCGERRHVIIVDRSLVGNAVFAAANYRNGSLDDGEFAMYCKQSMHIGRFVRRHADMGIYLWVKPETCIKRNVLRNSCDDDDDAKTKTLESKTYDTTYFWQVEVAAFAAMLSQLSKPVPRPHIVVNWHDEYSCASDGNMDRILCGYLARNDGVAPLRFSLSHDMMPTTCADHFFDFGRLKTVDEFFSKEVVGKVMDVVAHTTFYTGHKHVHLLLPRCVTSTSFSVLFPLTIVDACTSTDTNQ